MVLTGVLYFGLTLSNHFVIRPNSLMEYVNLDALMTPELAEISSMVAPSSAVIGPAKSPM